MNIFIKKTLAILSIAIFSFSYAQKIDAKAKAVLDGVAANYKAKKNNFFKFYYQGSDSKNQVGTFYSSGKKYKLNILGTEQIFDGNKVYSVNKEDQEITIAKPNADSEMLSPLSYIDTYKSGYNVQYVGKQKVGSVNTEHIKMTPVKNNGIKYVNLFINSANKQLVKLEQYSNDGQKAVITITSYSANQNLPATTFSFNKANYKNYLITEL